MAKKRSNRDPRPTLFKASDKKKIMGSLANKRAELDMVNTDNMSSSFRYDAFGQGFKSTQQVNTDFSNFENHTFFGSATVNTNIAFDRIVNHYPFDGTRKEDRRP